MLKGNYPDGPCHLKPPPPPRENSGVGMLPSCVEAMLITLFAAATTNHWVKGCAFAERKTLSVFYKEGPELTGVEKGFRVL